MNYVNDYLATGFLFFSNSQFIIPLIILGFIWLDRKLFYHCVCLLLVCMALNVALKISFAIPLNPSLGKEGFAFPSGHMQLSTVLYGWLAIRTRAKWLMGLIIILLIGIGISLNYYDYHNKYDVIAAVITGALLLTFYCKFLLKWQSYSAIIIFCLVSLIFIYIQLRQGKIPDFLWFPYFVFIGMALAENIVMRRVVPATTIDLENSTTDENCPNTELESPCTGACASVLRSASPCTPLSVASLRRSLMAKLLITVFFLTFACIIYTIFTLFFPPNIHPYLFKMQWLILGFILPFMSIGGFKR